MNEPRLRADHVGYVSHHPEDETVRAVFGDRGVPAMNGVTCSLAVMVSVSALAPFTLATYHLVLPTRDTQDVQRLVTGFLSGLPNPGRGVYRLVLQIGDVLVWSSFEQGMHGVGSSKSRLAQEIGTMVGDVIRFARENGWYRYSITPPHEEGAHG